MAIPSGWSGALKFCNYVQRVRPSLSYFCLNGAQRQYLFPRLFIGQCNAYAHDVQGEITAMREGGVLNPKKKKVFIPRVTLLTENDDMSVVTMEMAEKIAKRRNLKLVKILAFDTRTERPIFKLMSNKDYIQEGLARKKEKKSERETSLKPEKMLSVSSKIKDHDLQTKFKSVIKFLTKKHEVRFVITFDGDNEKGNAICTQLETVLKDVAVSVKKEIRGNKIKLHLRPDIHENVSNNSETEGKETNEKSPVDADSKTKAQHTTNESPVAPGS